MGTEVRLRHVRSTSLAVLRAVLAPSRLQLAAKAGLAAGLAWAVAPLIPGPAAQYAYYAPFGALISMYPTVASSARQGLQSLIGLAVGIGLAFTLVAFGRPNPVTVGLVIAVGLLLSGIPRIGAGKDWIPMAALFVLVIGGSHAESFSIGYLVQTGVGVAVGLLVNLLIFPPLHFNAAASSLQALRLRLATQLDDMGTAIVEEWPPDHEEWSRRTGELAEAATQVRVAVVQADQSRRANPRSRRYRHDIAADYNNVASLERVTFHVQDITDVLSNAIWEAPEDTPVPAELCDGLSAALSSTADLLRAWDSGGDTKAAVEHAGSAVQRASAEYHRLASPTLPVTTAASITLSLARAVRVVKVNLEG